MISHENNSREERLFLIQNKKTRREREREREREMVESFVKMKNEVCGVET